MNLVSYEYIVSQQKKHGVLILSEFAGAAQSLNGMSLFSLLFSCMDLYIHGFFCLLNIGSIIVNPWNTEELAAGIHDAVTMPDNVRTANFQKLFRYVTKYTAAHWGLSFVKELQRVSEAFDPKRLPKLPVARVKEEFVNAQKKKVCI